MHFNTSWWVMIMLIWGCSGPMERVTSENHYRGTVVNAHIAEMLK